MQSDVFLDPLLMERLKFLEPMKDKIFIYTTNPLVSLARYSDEDIRFILSMFDYLEVSVEGTNREDYRLMSGIDGFDVFYATIHKVRNIIDTFNLSIKINLRFRTYNVEKMKNDPIYIELTELFELGEVRDSYFSWSGTIKETDLPLGAKLIKKDNSDEVYDCAICMSTLAIQSDGKAIGCGCIDWNSKNIIGDCNKEDLMSIWNGNRALKFRKSFSIRDIPAICKKCEIYSAEINNFSQNKLETYKVNDGLYYLGV